MPVKEFPCPECGAEVSMGLPKGAAVKSISASDRPDPTASSRKARTLRCRNGHEFSVLFEW